MSRQREQPGRARQTQAREARRGRQHARRRRRRIIFGAVAGFAGLAIIVGLFLPQFGTTGGSSLPRGGGRGAAQIGDHRHASLQMEICGVDITLPPSGGGVHTHGAGTIHLHPGRQEEAGANANLGRFFDSITTMVMEPDRIQLPGEEQVYQNGQPCPDEQPGTVQVRVNGKDMTETFRSYTPREDDKVEVYFR